MIGKVVAIAGMIIEIVSDEGEKWKCRNFTTNETLLIEKSVIEKAIKLGKAEVLSNQRER